MRQFVFRGLLLALWLLGAGCALRSSRAPAALARPASPSAPGGPTGCGWQIVPSPNAGASHNRLDDVAVLGSADAWAVGNYEEYDGGPTHPLIERWDGQQWTIVPPTIATGRLRGISALAPNDIWAVGGDGVGGALALHWDGLQWNRVTVPNPVAICSYMMCPP